MDFIWWLIIGVFIGGIGTLVLMSILKVGSQSDDSLLSDRQYNED